MKTNKTTKTWIDRYSPNECKSPANELKNAKTSTTPNIGTSP